MPLWQNNPGSDRPRGLYRYTTMEDGAASVGTIRGDDGCRSVRARKYQVLPAMTMNAIPTASSIKLKRCLGAGGSGPPRSCSRRSAHLSE